MTLWPDAQSAEGVVENLLQAGIIVRPLRAFGVPNGVRITIGTPDDNNQLISAMSRILQQESLLCS